MKRITLNRCFLPAAAAMALGASSAFAADGNWNTDAAGNWNDGSNWTSNPTVPGGAGSTVGLNYNITAARTITINTTSATVGILNIGDPTATLFSYTLAASGGAHLRMDNSGSEAQINSSGAINTISAPVELTTGGVKLAVASGAGALSLTTGGISSVATSGTQLITMENSGNGLIQLSGAISDGSSGGKVGLLANGGAVSVTGSNSFTGGVTVRNGILRFGGTSAFGSSDVVIADSTTAATLQVNATTGSFNGKVIISSSGTGVATIEAAVTSTMTLSGELQMNRAATINTAHAASAVNVSGSITGSSLLTVANANGTSGGQTTLSGNNSGFSGGITLRDNNARLNINSATALGTGTFTISSTGTGIRIDNTSGSALTLSTNNAIAFNNSALTFVGTNNLNLGTGDVTLSSGNKTITTTAGVLTIGGAVIGTSQSLTKLGNGTLVLNGANTYTGDTDVQAGTLRGTGSVAGNVYISSGATLEAGNSIGTFTAAGEAGFLENSTFHFELNSTLGTADQLVANGLSLENNNVNFTFADLGAGTWTGPGTIVVISNTSGSAVSGTFDGYAEGASVIIGSNTFNLSYAGGVGGNDVVLTLVPEPGTWILAAAGLTLTLLRRRRH